MEDKDVLEAPVKILLFRWLENLFEKGAANFSEENKNIIELNSFVSSWFCIGRDNELLDPFLGIPKNLIPWFLQLRFKNAMVSPSRKRLYLSCGDNSTESLTLSFKIRAKRLQLLTIDNKNKLDFRIIAIKADRSVSVTQNVLSFIPLIISDDLEDIVPLVLDEAAKEEIYYNDVKSRFNNDFKMDFKNTIVDENEFDF